MDQRHFIGKLGEELACVFLMKHGFSITERNYLKKWGEIDIISEINGEIHFVEVKTVSRHIKIVDHGGSTTKCRVDDIDERLEYIPEDNIHPWKIQRLLRAIQSYVSEHNVSDETLWQLDLVTVELDLDSKKSKINYIENIV